MFPKTFRRFVALVLMLTTLATTTVGTVASANQLTDALNVMVNTTSPGYATSRDRGVLVGGSLSIRAPVKQVNLFYFDPPRLNAGCGGIDIYMGSFSFINADAFKGMLKAIAQAAAGYFFKLALASLCPICESILTSLQDLATILNNSALNSCAIGRSLAEKGVNMMEQITKGKEAQALDTSRWVGDGGRTITTGAIGDWVGGVQRMFANKPKVEDDTKYYSSYSGNWVWKAMVQNKALEAFNADPANNKNQMLGQVEFAEMIMSMIGTVIVAPQKLGQTQPEEVYGSDLPTGSYQSLSQSVSDRIDLCKPEGNPSACTYGHFFKPKLMYWDLIGGSAPARKKWRCKTEAGGYEVDTKNALGCLDIIDADFDFVGTEKYVNWFLFCGASTPIGGLQSATEGDSSACYMGGRSEPGSIVYKITAGEMLSGPQLGFLNNFKLPVARLLLEVQRSREGAEQVARMFAPHMAMTIALNIGYTMDSIVSKTFSKNVDAGMLSETMENVTIFRQYLQTASATNKNIVDVVIGVTQAARDIRAMDAVTIVPTLQRGG